MIRLNLLPKNLRRRVEPGWWRLAAALFALVVLGTLGFLHYTAYTELSLARSERDALRAEVEALKPFIVEQNRLVQERKTLEALLAIREGLRKNFVPWSEYLAAFINQIPKEGGRLPVALRSVGTVPSRRRRPTPRPKTGPLAASGCGWSSPSRGRSRAKAPGALRAGL